MDKQQLKKYYNLIDSFLKKETCVDSFTEQYMNLFKNDNSHLGEFYEVLNNVFLDLDEYTPDAKRGESFAIDEKKLRGRCEKSLELLKQRIREEEKSPNIGDGFI